MRPAAAQKNISEEYGSDAHGAKVETRMTVNPVDATAIIHRLTFFDTFTADEKRQIASEDAHFRMYNPGELLIRQGSSDRSLFIILSGSVAVTGSAGGTVLAVLRAGDIFGEMAFLTDTRRTANVVARDAVIALKLDSVLFEQLPAEVREKFKDKIIKKLVSRLETANKELTRLCAVAGNGPFEMPENLVAPAHSFSSESEAPAFESGRELIRKIISQTASLPAMPEVMIKVQKLIQHPATTPAQLAKIIETDPSMVAGILKVANSAYYGFRGKVSTIQHASSLFGTRRLAELITAMSAGGVLGKAMDGYGHKAGDMWRHSILVACTASEIAAIVADEILDSAYMAGLLHDIGKIILDPYVCERKMLFEHYFSKYPDKTIQEAEGHILGFDHAVIAAILCEKWSLPKTIAFGIRNHHQPSSASDHLLSHIVHLADYLSGRTGKERERKPPAKVLDSATRSILSLDPDTMDAIMKKARQYAQSLTGRLAKR